MPFKIAFSVLLLYECIIIYLGYWGYFQFFALLNLNTLPFFSSNRRSLVISPPVRTSIVSSPLTSPTSPSALSLKSEKDSSSASEEELASDSAQGEDNSEIKEEPLKDKETEEEAETSSSEEEEPLLACNGPTQSQPSPLTEDRESQEEVFPCSPAPSPRSR